MSDTLTLILILGGWLFLYRWLLPKMGINT